MIYVQQVRNRKEPLIPKSTEDMIEVLSVVGDISNMMTLESDSFIEVTTSPSSVGSFDDMPSDSRPRKRAKLDHLSSEEKAQHRKMMNRISAQSARDRQKAMMSQQEVTIKNLVVSNENLKKENSTLSSKCYSLTEENERLSNLVKEYEEKMKKLDSMPVQVKVKQEQMSSFPEECGNAERSLISSLEPAEGTGTVEKLLMHSTSMDLFSLDLDAPELIQALEDFTKQILSPNIQLSSGLEEVITSDSTISSISTVSNPINGINDEGYGSRLEPPQGDASSPSPAHSELHTVTSAPQDQAVSPHNDTLPLTEPDFQMLSDIFQDYNYEHLNVSPPEIPSIPIDKYTDALKPKIEDFNPLMDSYPYESWDSPGSVESDILFPELSF